MAEAFPGEMNYSKEFQEWKVWVSQNKLKSIGSLWVGLMASNICYQFTRYSFLLSVLCLSVYLSVCFFLVPLTFLPLYLPDRPVPLQLKLIHSRVYSQFVTIAAVGAIGLAEALDPSMKKRRGGDY